MQKLAGKRGILAALDHELAEDATVEDAIDYLLTCKLEEGLETTGRRMIPHEEIVERSSRGQVRWTARP